MINFISDKGNLKRHIMKQKAIRKPFKRLRGKKSLNSLRLQKTVEESYARWAIRQSDLEMLDFRRKTNGFYAGIDEENSQNSDEEEARPSTKSIRSQLPPTESESSENEQQQLAAAGRHQFKRGKGPEIIVRRSSKRGRTFLDSQDRPGDGGKGVTSASQRAIENKEIRELALRRTSGYVIRSPPLRFEPETIHSKEIKRKEPPIKKRVSVFNNVALKAISSEREETLKKLTLEYSLKREELDSDIFLFDMDAMKSWDNYLPNNNIDAVVANIKLKEGKPRKKKISFTSLFRKKKASYNKSGTMKVFLK